MRYNIELVQRNQQENSVLIRGWVLDDIAGDVPEISVQASVPILDEELHMKVRPDIAARWPRHKNTKTGFGLKIWLTELREDITLTFKVFTTSQTVELHLDRKYAHPMENGSPLLLFARAWGRYSPYLKRRNWPALAEKIKRKAPEGDPRYLQWMANVEHIPTASAMRRDIKQLAYKPLISIIVPVYNVDPKWLAKMAGSVQAQAYENWELCLADDCSTDPRVRQELERLKQADSRIRVVYRTENGHISRASNDALKIARGEFVSLLDNDDELAPHALFEVVKYLNEHPETDLVYSDEDKINAEGVRTSPYFKSDYAPDSLMSNNYICHFTTMRKSVLDKTGGFRPGFEGAQDHDLMLRFAEQTDRIGHIQKILYHWRMLPSSTASASSAKDYATKAGVACVQEALDRRGTPGTASQGKAAGIYKINYDITEPGKVSIIIPTKNNGEVLRTCVESILDQTVWKDYEILIADNGSTSEETLNTFKQLEIKAAGKLKIIRIDIPFNYSRINNLAAAQADGKYLLFLNDDTQVITRGWIKEMLGYCQQPWIGAVGAKLYYPDGLIQHAGVIVDVGHAYYHAPREDFGYYGKLIAATNFTAVTAACLMVTKQHFEQAGGFDETLEVAYNDVDFCCALAELGLYNVFDPNVELYHYESKTRGYDVSPEKQKKHDEEMALVKKRRANYFKHDPMYNDNLDKNRPDYAPRVE